MQQLRVCNLVLICKGRDKVILPLVFSAQLAPLQNQSRKLTTLAAMSGPLISKQNTNSSACFCWDILSGHYSARQTKGLKIYHPNYSCHATLKGETLYSLQGNDLSDCAICTGKKCKKMQREVMHLTRSWNLCRHVQSTRLLPEATNY